VETALTALGRGTQRAVATVCVETLFLHPRAVLRDRRRAGVAYEVRALRRERGRSHLYVPGSRHVDR